MMENEGEKTASFPDFPKHSGQECYNTQIVWHTFLQICLDYIK